MKTSATLLIAALLLTTGCSGSHYYWYQPGKTLEQVRADYQECQRKASREAAEALNERYVQRTRSPGRAASSYNTPGGEEMGNDPDYTWFAWGDTYERNVFMGHMKAKGYTRLPAHRLPDKVRTKTLFLDALAGR